MEKDKDEIQIYTREVPGKQLKELRVVTHFNVNALVGYLVDHCCHGQACTPAPRGAADCGTACDGCE